MPEVVSNLPGAATLLYAVSSMLSVGFKYTLREVVDPLRSAWAVVRVLIANFVLVPLVALGVVRLVGLDPPLAVGLILVGTAAGAPFLIRLTTVAVGDAVALGATLLVLLLPTTIIYMPLVVPVVIPGATVSAGAIAVPLVFSMLLPLAFALFVRARAPRCAAGLQPVMVRTSSYSLVALIALTVLINLPAMLDVTMRAILAAVLVTCGAFVVGYLLGADSQRRTVLGLGTGQRNISAAAVVATQGFGNPETLIMVIVTALVGLAILFPIANQLRKREAERVGVSPTVLPEPT